MPSIGDDLQQITSAAGASQASVAFVPLSFADPQGCPVAVRRTRPRALTAPSLLPFSVSLPPRPRGGGAISALVPHTHPSRESGAAAGGLCVSELTALRARGTWKGARAPWSVVSQGKNRRTQRGEDCSGADRGSRGLVPARCCAGVSLPCDRAACEPPSGATSTAHSNTTSDQTRQPAEFKHITKRRKRN